MAWRLQWGLRGDYAIVWSLRFVGYARKRALSSTGRSRDRQVNPVEVMERIFWEEIRIQIFCICGRKKRKEISFVNYILILQI